MDPTHRWTVTIGGTASSALNADAAVDALVAALRRRPGRRPVRWRLDKDGTTVLFGAVASGNEDDGWRALWADDIRWQLSVAPGGAS